jgi:hypothetical protein
MDTWCAKEAGGEEEREQRGGSAVNNELSERGNGERAKEERAGAGEESSKQTGK